MLKLKNLKFTPFKSEQVAPLVLNDISIQIKKNDFCLIVGSNGAGKSSLLKAIIGEYELASGDILLNERKISKLPQHLRCRDIGYVSQNPSKGTIGELTVLDNLRLAGAKNRKASYFYNLDNKEKDRFKYALSKLNMNLENKLNIRVEQLSGGQKQALSLIMATINPPKLLLLDEHCSALDPKTSRLVMDITQNIIKEQSITTLMITHNLKDAINYGNRLIMLSKGKIAYDFNDKDKEKLTMECILKLFHLEENSE